MILNSSLKSSKSNLYNTQSQLSLNTQSNLALRKTFTTFKDPGSKPVCDKNDLLSKNLNDLPESRLKLIVSEKVLLNDDFALNLISSKLKEEEFQNNQKQKKLADMREHLRNEGNKRKLHMEKLLVKSGLVRHVVRRAQNWSITNRINSLAQPRVHRKGLAQDCLESLGLLKAGVLESGQSVIPKSARMPVSHINSPFPIRKHEIREISSTGKISAEKFGVFSDEEIRDCMKDIDVFHERIGKGKGKVGFPQIYLEKYKKGN